MTHKKLFDKKRDLMCDAYMSNVTVVTIIRYVR